MFQNIKSYLTGVGLIWRHAGVVSELVSAWMRYPGIGNSEELRTWVRPVLHNLASLTSITETPIDDMIAVTALRVVENDKAWAVVHNLTLLVRDGGEFQNGVLVPEESIYATQSLAFDTITNETMPGCPALVHAAIGLLLYLLQQRFGRGAL